MRRRLAPALLLVGLVLASPAPTQERLRLPPGFVIEPFAERLGRPRFMTLDPAGTLLVSVPRAGSVVALPDADGDGRADRVATVVEGLHLPHGLAFAGGRLYVAETGRVLRFRYDPKTLRVEGPPEVVIPGLPPGGGHWTRTIAFSPDGRLYVSVGSSCNVCQEQDPRRAAILRTRADGTAGTEPFASGLRNAVGIAFHPETGQLWAAVNERDWRGDDLPPDYVTAVKAGGFYGWPSCHTVKGRVVPDPEFGGRDGCDRVTPPTVEIQAHSAPLGLAFYTGRQFPPEYRGDLFVALHGSWNRSVPTGYKVVRIRLGGARPEVQDFASGWLVGQRAWGRPVDLVVGKDGSLFLSDDHQGLIYRIRYHG